MDVTELRRKADQGDADAKYTLGYHLVSVSQDYAKAAALFRRAADQGRLSAQCEFGKCYLEGTGVPQDHREGARLFRRAANKGHASAQCALGNCYEFSKGMP